jgi:hypothetical protein
MVHTPTGKLLGTIVHDGQRLSVYLDRHRRTRTRVVWAWGDRPVVVHVIATGFAALLQEPDCPPALASEAVKAGFLIPTGWSRAARRRRAYRLGVAHA